MKRALPRLIIRHFTERLQVEWAAGEWEHRHRFTHPYIVLLQPLLETADLTFIVVFGQDQVRLHPRDTFARLDQQLRNAVCGHAAILVQLIATFVSDALDPTLHRDG